MMDRRSFLKAGLGGTLLLGTVSLGAGLSGCDAQPAGERPDLASSDGAGYRFGFLTDADIVMFQALVPAVIAPALTQKERLPAVTAQTIRDIDAGILRFSTATRKEIRQLFDLLTFGPSRLAMTRIWSWENASQADTAAFLERWRTSRFGLFNKGYIAITKLTNVAFYGNAANFALSGYPGPPPWATAALPQFQTETL
ncbi:hypothetical protein [Marinobacter sp.]|jgi:hypothetical protein|uniref:hypothetical protein n=1 Tax=Marinobacter sp. TaxID=50741 RepID=UPI0019BC1EF4|nr:hypothetical protein [Marinobacter sp.]MBC7191274.1 hypothetical protein [Marinobacter sp.]MDY6797414.1 hypothetical protein [Pseudomonadota bacterium]